MASANLQAVILWSAVAFAVYCALILLARSARLIGRRRTRGRRRQAPIEKAVERDISPSMFLEPPAAAPPEGPADASAQLRHVMDAEFTRKRVMSRGEYRVFRIIEVEVDANWRGYRVFSQTVLGEVIESTDGAAHSAINAKRVDALVIDAAGYPVLAVEVQGKGHYQGQAAARDAVKKEALRKAGVAYLEVMDYHTEGDITHLVRETLNRTVPERAPQPAA